MRVAFASTEGRERHGDTGIAQQCLALPRRDREIAGERASRDCAVSDAPLKQASCVVVPVVRPWPSPGRFGKRLRRIGKSLEMFSLLHTND